MTATAVVRLVDGRLVTVAEPAWCVGRHQDGLDLSDLAHDGPETWLTVRTGRGLVEILQYSLGQYPYALDPAKRGVVGMVLLGAAWYEVGPEDVLALADGLVSRAAELRVLARELAGLVHP